MTDKDLLDKLNGERGDWRHNLQWFSLGVVIFLVVVSVALAFGKHSKDSSKNPQMAEISEAPSSEPTVEPTLEPTPTPEPTPEPVVSLAFTGDISLADDSPVMRNMLAKNSGIEGGIGKKLINILQNADASIVNNEFCYSGQGEPLRGKQYTFRANPDNVNYLNNLGIDVANLANNHVYDYGREAFFDTLSTLKNAGIKTVGAGQNLKQASKPAMLKIKGKKIAIVAASRAEKYKLTPEATSTESGVFTTYDSTNYCNAIKKAKKKADIVIAYVHWGTEYSTNLENEQVTMAKQYIDSGADVVVGSHTHTLQGTDMYKGKPIFYSLGNFWFNDKTGYSTILKLNIKADGTINAFMVPCRQSACMTTPLKTKQDKTAFKDYINNLSQNTELTRNFKLIEKPTEGKKQ